MRDLVESAYDFDLPMKTRHWAHQRLRTWTKTEVQLRHFPITDIASMIVYEVNARRRQYVVKRLLSRYSKLRREAEWEHLKRMMEEKDERARNRAISMSTSRGS